MAGFSEDRPMGNSPILGNQLMSRLAEGAVDMGIMAVFWCPLLNRHIHHRLARPRGRNYNTRSIGICGRLQPLSAKEPTSLQRLVAILRLLRILLLAIRERDWIAEDTPSKSVARLFFADKVLRHAVVDFLLPAKVYSPS